MAPSQTLTDKEYQRLRDAAVAIIREMGVECGGSNVQVRALPQRAVWRDVLAGWWVGCFCGSPEPGQHAPWGERGAHQLADLLCCLPLLLAWPPADGHQP